MCKPSGRLLVNTTKYKLHSIRSRQSHAADRCCQSISTSKQNKSLFYAQPRWYNSSYLVSCSCGTPFVLYFLTRTSHDSTHTISTSTAPARHFSDNPIVNAKLNTRTRCVYRVTMLLSSCSGNRKVSHDPLADLSGCNIAAFSVYLRRDSHMSAASSSKTSFTKTR